MKRRTLKRMKLAKHLTRRDAFILIRSRMRLPPVAFVEWKYNPVTGWVSVKIR